MSRTFSTFLGIMIGLTLLALGCLIGNADYRESGAAGQTNSFKSTVAATGEHLPACCGIPGVPINNSAAGTTGAVVATLAAAAGKFTYLCGFTATAVASAAALGTVTVAGITTSLVYGQAVPAASAMGTVDKSFGGCIPSSAVNTAITITTSAIATGTQVNVTALGFQL